MSGASVIVSTYNQPAYLELVLLSFAVQRTRPMEVVVADDGSGPETRQAVDAFRAEAPFPVKHVWQEDEGFRKAMALNRAARECASECLIFNDGDCIAHPEFVRAHLDLATSGGFVVGRTPRLSQKLTSRVTAGAVRRGVAQRMSAAAIWDGLRGESRKMEFGFFVGSDLLFRLVTKTKKNLELWGGNFSCFRKDYITVNGFNEEFVGWGKEDLDLGCRFRNLGLRPISGANRAINFHLWHPKPAGRAYNVWLQNEIRQRYRESGEYYCPVGYDRR